MFLCYHLFIMNKDLYPDNSDTASDALTTKTDGAIFSLPKFASNFKRKLFELPYKYALSQTPPFPHYEISGFTYCSIANFAVKLVAIEMNNSSFIATFS